MIWRAPRSRPGELRVDWPSGRRDVHRDVEADRYYVVEEGGAMRPERRPFVAP